MSYAALANVTNLSATQPLNATKPFTPIQPQSISNNVPRDILKWLQTLDLSYSISSPLHNELASGFIVGEILCAYYRSTVIMQINAFDNGVSGRAKKNNWDYIVTFLERHSNLDMSAHSDTDSVSGQSNTGGGGAGVDIDAINWYTVLNNRALLTAVQYGEPGASVELLVQMYRLLTGRTIPGYTPQWRSTANRYSMANQASTLIAQHQQHASAYMRPTVSLLIKSRMHNSDMLALRDNPTIEARVSQRIVADYTNVKQYDRQVNPERYTYVPNTTKYDLNGTAKSSTMKRTASQSMSNTISKSLANTLSKTTQQPAATDNGVIHDVQPVAAVDVIEEVKVAQASALDMLSATLQSKLPGASVTDNVFALLPANVPDCSELDIASAVQQTSNSSDVIQAAITLCINDNSQYIAVLDALLTALTASKPAVLVYNELLALLHTIDQTLYATQPDASYALLSSVTLDKLLQHASQADIALIKLAYSCVSDTPNAHAAVLQQISARLAGNPLLLLSVASQMFTLETNIDQQLFAYYDTTASNCLISPDSAVRLSAIQLVCAYASSADVNMIGYVNTQLQDACASVQQMPADDAIEWCTVATVALLNETAGQTQSAALQLIQAVLSRSQPPQVTAQMLTSTSVLLGKQPIIRQQWLELIASQPLVRDAVLASNSMAHSVWHPLTVVQCVGEYVTARQLENMSESLVVLVSTAINDAVYDAASVEQWTAVLTVLRDFLVVELCDPTLCAIVVDVFVRILTDVTLQPSMLTTIFNTTDTVTQSSLFGIMRYIYLDSEPECQHVFAQFVQALLSEQQTESLRSCVTNLLQQFKLHEPQKYHASPLAALQLR